MDADRCEKLRAERDALKAERAEIEQEIQGRSAAERRLSQAVVEAQRDVAETADRVNSFRTLGDFDGPAAVGLDLSEEECKAEIADAALTAYREETRKLGQRVAQIVEEVEKIGAQLRDNCTDGEKRG